ncbi:MAG: VWA domain-containing protein [Planctomycetes bacterium]|nr:VWA domain-containing protein [Planctomycetota bacterium]
MFRRTLPFLALALLPSLAAAQGFMQVSDRSLQAMPVKYHKVEVTVDNQVATTEVDQVFLNPNGRQIEATYVFPVPAGASMSRLSMWINGVEQEAELLDSEKARGIYEDIVRSRQDPALLEFVGSRMFRLRVFPILPGEEKRVKLSYSETLKADAGICQFRYGLNTARFSSQAVQEVRVSVKVKSNVPIKGIISPSHAVDVARKSDFEATAVYEAANVAPDRDFVLYYSQGEGEFGLNLVAQRTPGEDGYFMLLLAPRAEARDGEILKRDVCFVLDTSMSMSEQDRIAQAKKALKAGLQTLNPGDRFNVVAFSTEVYPWSEALMEANDANIQAAGGFIEKLKARGGTNISGALEKALALSPGDAARPYMVIFMTDGEPTLGEVEPDRILALTREKNSSKARIFTLGVGFDLNVRLLDLLAEEHGGLREYVTPTEALETRMAAYYEKLGAPVLSDVKLEIPGDGTEIYDVYPKKLTDIFKGQQIAVFGRFRADGARSIRLKGTVNGQPREFVYETRFPAQSAEHESVPRLWAISKVGHLSDAIRLNGEKEELKKEIIALAKEFGVVTQYTSFLVLEDNARNGVAGGRFGGRRNLRVTGGGGAPAPEAPRNGFERKGIPAAGAPTDDPAVMFPDGEESDHNESADGRMKGDSGESMGRGRAPGKAAGVYDAMGVGGGAGGVKASRDADAMKGGRDVGGSKKVQQVGTRTFYLSDEGVWVDGEFKPEMKKTTIEYLSDEYFKLLKDKPGLARYFAIGGRLIVVISENEALEVVPAPEKK